MSAALIHLEWPDFGSAKTRPAIPLHEFQQRLARLRQTMQQQHFSHVVVYGDREHFANLAYLTGFDPRFEEALLIVGPSGHPLLLVGNECEAYLPISPLWRAGQLRKERYQPFSLLDQPRDTSRHLEEIFASEGIHDKSRVGAVGWKYYSHPQQMDLPSYIVDALRSLAPVEDFTTYFQHPAHGFRARCSAHEILAFEHANTKASDAFRRIQFALRPGLTDQELLAEARYDGEPLSSHMTLKTGPKRISLASASGNLLEVGHTWSANIAYWGSNICRAAWVAEGPQDLPAPARDYAEAFAGPYFAALAEWICQMRIGTSCGDLYRFIHENLPQPKYNIFLNPGHLIHLDEWLSSPFYAGSDIPIQSGMLIQTDVIPSSPQYFSTRMEEGIAIANEALREELASLDPAFWRRCQARRQFVQEALAITPPPELLLLSNMPCLVSPYLLRPNHVFINIS
jgi:hypothetical protein